MEFVSEEHGINFADLMSLAEIEDDCEHAAAIYVLAALDKNLGEYITPDAIEFTKLINASGPWSSSEKAMVRLAATLFNGSAWPVPIYEVFESLGEDWTRVALEAMRIRYGRRG